MSANDTLGFQMRLQGTRPERAARETCASVCSLGSTGVGLRRHDCEHRDPTRNHRGWKEVHGPQSQQETCSHETQFRATVE